MHLFDREKADGDALFPWEVRKGVTSSLHRYMWSALKPESTYEFTMTVKINGIEYDKARVREVTMPAQSNCFIISMLLFVCNTITGNEWHVEDFQFFNFYTTCNVKIHISMQTPFESNI